MELNYQEISDKIQNWIKQTVHQANFTDVVIALSGGIDSAVAASLAVKAQGKDHVHVLLMPYGALSNKGTEDARKVTKSLELPEQNIHVVDIKSIVDSFKLESDKTEYQLKIRKGNIMARVRMTYLYDFAKKFNALVVGTENKSEYYLSYFTRFGDEASDIEPIRNLYKTQIFELAKYLGVPKEVIKKAPSAGLWEGQSDEDEFGFSYKDADRVLYHHFDEGLPLEGIVKLGISEETVRKVLKWVEKNDFKHHLPHIYH